MFKPRFTPMVASHVVIEITVTKTNLEVIGTFQFGVTLQHHSYSSLSTSALFIDSD